ncbi:hypothetical protein [Nissabacter sp. SGAir0207]|uniref:hypothetical protein n=1 Tax=Nissabacter sp. SGAir0207 TaxID=2126321 RepID=UPI0010F9E8E5|nr:hypothetical protein [Nissabacter sp. SGAir0207]
MSEQPLWQQKIWLCMTIGLGIITLSMIGLIGFISYKTLDRVFSLRTEDMKFFVAGIGIIITSLIKLLSILIGGAIVFGGLAISFHTHDKITTLTGDVNDEKTPKIGANISTYSPGIVGIIIGGVIIVSTIYKENRINYEPTTSQSTGNSFDFSMPPPPKK